MSLHCPPHRGGSHGVCIVWIRFSLLTRWMVVTHQDNICHVVRYGQLYKINLQVLSTDF